MTAPLLQSPVESVHQYLNSGEAVGGIVSTLVLLGCIGAVVIIMVRIQKQREHVQLNDPQRLFRSVIGRLGLSVMQRDLLRRMSRDIRLQHPTTLLLSPTIFSNHAARWISTQVETEPEAERHLRALIDATSRALYGVASAELQGSTRDGERLGDSIEYHGLTSTTTGT